MHDDVSDARRWTMLVCSMIAAMTTTCVVSGVPYLIPTLHTGEGLSLTTASVIATVPTIGLMIGIIPWGVLLDRYGERLVLTVSLSGTLVAAIASAAAALADAPTAVLAAFLF
ncbi:MAG: MFS transporter, partial [Gordonia amarae]